LLSSPVIPATDVNAIFEQRSVYRNLFWGFSLASNSSQSDYFGAGGEIIALMHTIPGPQHEPDIFLIE
jgi:hypothetical protein